MTAPGENRRADARRSFRIAVAVLLFCLVVVAVYGWYMLRDSQMSTVAVIALAAGVVLTLVVGIGLMSLLFYSSREGFDEQVRRRK
jgi:ABC-type spermidine/putrescine transport system permease subunit II